MKLEEYDNQVKNYTSATTRSLFSKKDRLE